ncbi:MAG TPA: hypothetical protein DGG94_13975 [Micromonosporaceae bacterium]|nr:hypothetical protein [Micromonosporaceae bacterium]HCU50885.1 hypothetical protein [Micromonosporaceae bacterium]
MTAVVIVLELAVASRRAQAVDVAIQRLRAANMQQWDSTDETVQRLLDGLRGMGAPATQGVDPAE